MGDNIIITIDKTGKIINSGAMDSIKCGGDLLITGDLNDNVIIVDREENRVYHVTQDGQLINNMLTFSPESGVKSILTMSIYSESGDEQALKLHNYSFSTPKRYVIPELEGKGKPCCTLL